MIQTNSDKDESYQHKLAKVIQEQSLKYSPLTVAKAMELLQQLYTIIISASNLKLQFNERFRGTNFVNFRFMKFNETRVIFHKTSKTSDVEPCIQSVVFNAQTEASQIRDTLQLLVDRGHKYIYTADQVNTFMYHCFAFDYFARTGGNPIFNIYRNAEEVLNNVHNDKQMMIINPASLDLRSYNMTHTNTDIFSINSVIEIFFANGKIVSSICFDPDIIKHTGNLYYTMEGLNILFKLGYVVIAGEDFIKCYSKADAEYKLSQLQSLLSGTKL